MLSPILFIIFRHTYRIIWFSTHNRHRSSIPHQAKTDTAVKNTQPTAFSHGILHAFVDSYAFQFKIPFYAIPVALRRPLPDALSIHSAVLFPGTQRSPHQQP